jgi:hypothetical protein
MLLINLFLFLRQRDFIVNQFRSFFEIHHIFCSEFQEVIVHKNAVISNLFFSCSLLQSLGIQSQLSFQYNSTSHLLCRSRGSYWTCWWDFFQISIRNVSFPEIVNKIHPAANTRSLGPYLPLLHVYRINVLRGLMPSVRHIDLDENGRCSSSIQYVNIQKVEIKSVLWYSWCMEVCTILKILSWLLSYRIVGMIQIRCMGKRTRRVQYTPLTMLWEVLLSECWENLMRNSWHRSRYWIPCGTLG